MCYIPTILGSSLALASPGCDADFQLMVGLRSVIATSIELDGFPCERVLTIEESRFHEDGGRVLKVLCGVAGPGRDRTYKVIAYTEGDFEACPWEARSEEH